MTPGLLEPAVYLFETALKLRETSPNLIALLWDNSLNDYWIENFEEDDGLMILLQLDNFQHNKIVKSDYKQRNKEEEEEERGRNF